MLISSALFARTFIAYGNKIIFGVLIFSIETAYNKYWLNDCWSLAQSEVTSWSIFPDNIEFKSIFKCDNEADKEAIEKWNSFTLARAIKDSMDVQVWS